MKKSLPLIIVVAVIVVGLATWNFLGRNKQALIENGVQQTETTQEEAKGESFTGKIKDAFMRNVPLKCTYQMDENNSSVGWLKDKKYYSEIAADGKMSYLILIDNCMWVWNKDEKDKGVKMCFVQQQDEDFWESFEESQEVAGYNYKCSPAIINDAVFTPPADVKFTDIDALMDQATQGEVEE